MNFIRYCKYYKRTKRALKEKFPNIYFQTYVSRPCFFPEAKELKYIKGGANLRYLQRSIIKLIGWWRRVLKFMTQTYMIQSRGFFIINDREINAVYPLPLDLIKHKEEFCKASAIILAPLGYKLFVNHHADYNFMIISYDDQLTNEYAKTNYCGFPVNSVFFAPYHWEEFERYEV